jgi:hypothetical protein
LRGDISISKKEKKRKEKKRKDKEKVREELRYLSQEAQNNCFPQHVALLLQHKPSHLHVKN